jgi:hypothetical protein
MTPLFSAKLSHLVAARGGRVGPLQLWSDNGSEITGWHPSLGQQPTKAEVEAVELPPSYAIALGEQHVEAAGLTGPRLVTLMDLLMQTREANALSAKPKLVALYTWLQTVKGMAVAGQTTFPPIPHTFEEVISE